MDRLIVAIFVWGFCSQIVSAAEVAPLFKDLKNPSSVTVGMDGAVYVAVMGEIGTKGDGSILRFHQGESVAVATELDDPCSLVWFQGRLIFVDGSRVLQLDAKMQKRELAGTAAFPNPVGQLTDLVVDPETGTIYVADRGKERGPGAIYSIAPKGPIRRIGESGNISFPKHPSSLVMDGKTFLLVTDADNGTLIRVRVTDGASGKVADGFGTGGAMAWDYFGRLYVGNAKTGQFSVIPRAGEKAIAMPGQYQNLTDISYDPVARRLLVVDRGAGTVTAVPTQVPGQPVDESPTGLETKIAFPNLTWTGWNPESEDGKPSPLRPIVMTHAGDGTNRVFVATQHGVIHVFPNDDAATKTKVFLDIRDRVTYNDKTNEEGFLGLAFHPNFKSNGEFFVFYTPRTPAKANIVSRFRVSKDDPNRADPQSEEEILRYINRPFWNHDGGTVCFGPDGKLYITHGDGGSANDPFENGQNLNTWFGKILRVDVDRKADGKNYAIPPDNPFVGKPDAKPEIWALGIRNIWRMAFDRDTGKLWAADVGQNLYEEINIIERGGNYGWNRRESFHPFGVKGVGVNPDMIDPIWEYHHDVGKSITGGSVYRGTQFPELTGHYLYADYVSSKIWALKYDDEKKRVVANRTIKDQSRPIISFGEDPQGELYLLTPAVDGRGIYRLTR